MGIFTKFIDSLFTDPILVRYREHERQHVNSQLVDTIQSSNLLIAKSIKKPTGKG